MRFSIIVPLFNKAPYIKKCLESVFAQSFSDYELIIVDDGSLDSSFEIAKSIVSESRSTYQLIHQENCGVSAARNNGVAVSHGDYLCFLDADDWWDSSFLERVNGLIHVFPDAGVYGTNYFCVKNGRSSICVTTAETGLINYCKVYAEKCQMPLWTGAVCIPRCVFDEMGGFRLHLKLGEDFDLWIKIALKYKVAFLNEPLSYYNQDSDPTWRLVGRLHEPKSHMLWNLDYLSDLETTNSDYKKLIDNLRTYSLLPYYLSKRYRYWAEQELVKVDWDKQPKRVRFLYKTPVFLLQCRELFLRYGSNIKQFLIKHL